MSTPSPEADAEILERVVRQGRETMARLRRARAELSQVTGTGRTSDGMVRAVADGQGGIVELRLDPRVMRLDHVSLGARITAVLQDAQREAEARARRVTEEALADTATLPDALDERFVRDRVDRIAGNLMS
ncbi:Conserved DNA-binding protein YbaB [Nonomuraea maritima]|uniref:Conserved DNA-binding protein YbaB n=1 Tax=Nonomuraea maritima TaxID=683260 RepID=A0A1G9G2J0_9ACTN|nr:YbaB/EbfC family nucleoid-associated protein [Nonomuraea maritima]SDK94866.1 Conserved DNA-binding protein YbaB [Nonomuraea maritima]